MILIQMNWKYTYLLLLTKLFYMLDNEKKYVYILAENTFVCPDCTMEFLDEADFEEHRINYDHASKEATNKCIKYNNIVMIPGNHKTSWFKSISIK